MFSHCIKKILINKYEKKKKSDFMLTNHNNYYTCFFWFFLKKKQDLERRNDRILYTRQENQRLQNTLND